MKIPAPPPGTGAAGRRMWRSIMVAYQLSEVEEVLLRQAVRTADHVADLDAALAAEGLLVAGRDGVPRPHAALVEVRQQRLVLTRLLAALRLPAEDSSARSQRRGVYGLGTVS